jgi:ribonuclease HI
MTHDKIDWKRMCFKKNKVWMAVDQKQRPVVKNGKVLIKYQLDQDYEYWILQKNIKPLEALPSKIPAAQKGKSNKKSLEPPGKKPDSETGSSVPPDPKDAICIFTDGASSGNPGPSGIGVFLRFGEYEKEISKYIGTATNNIAELEAIRTGLSAVKNTDLPVRVFTDSSYAYGVLVLGWKARKNQEIITSIKQMLSQFRDLEFIKVKGHAGIEGNEKADLLATSAIEEGKHSEKK